MDPNRSFRRVPPSIETTFVVFHISAALSAGLLTMTTPVPSTSTMSAKASMTFLFSKSHRRSQDVSCLTVTVWQLTKLRARKVDALRYRLGRSRDRPLPTRTPRFAREQNALMEDEMQGVAVFS